MLYNNNNKFNYFIIYCKHNLIEKLYILLDGNKFNKFKIKVYIYIYINKYIYIYILNY